MGRASKKVKVMLGKKTWRRKCYTVNMHLHLLVRASLWGSFVSLTCAATALGCFPTSSRCCCFLLEQVLLISGQVYVQGNPEVGHSKGSHEDSGELGFFSATGLWPPGPKWNCEERFHGKLWESITK